VRAWWATRRWPRPWSAPRTRDGVGIARALREAAAVDESVLTAAAADHAVDAVFDLLRWSDGDFSFVVDEPNPDDLAAAMSVDDIVTEGRRRLELWTTLAQTIPSSDTVLAVALPAPADLTVSPDEWALLAIVDGQRSVADLVAVSGRGEFAVVETLATLVDRGLVVVRRDGDDVGGVSQLLTRQAALAAYEAALASRCRSPSSRSRNRSRSPGWCRHPSRPPRRPPFPPLPPLPPSRSRLASQQLSGRHPPPARRPEPARSPLPGPSPSCRAAARTIPRRLPFPPPVSAAWPLPQR